MDNLEQRFKELADPDANVKYDRGIYFYEISYGIMLDQNILECVICVALSNPSGILHWTTDDVECIDMFVMELKKSGAQNISALPISGKPSRADLLKKRFKHHNIEILDGYADGFDGCYEGSEKFVKIYGKKEIKHPYPSYWMKSIVVNPPTKEVLLHSPREGYIQLHPRV